MRWTIHAGVLLLVFITAAAACEAEPTGMGAPSFLRASIQGSRQAQYEGDGTFQLLPAGVQGGRFTLHSSGEGTSAGQEFSFRAMEAPTLGEHPVGELDSQTYRATYSYTYEDGRRVKIFVASFGTVKIIELTARHVSGTFRITATLVADCALTPGFPGPFLECERAQEEASVELTGSFSARPLGGDHPGLVPSPVSNP